MIILGAIAFLVAFLLFLAPVLVNPWIDDSPREAECRLTGRAAWFVLSPEIATAQLENRLSEPSARPPLASVIGSGVI